MRGATAGRFASLVCHQLTLQLREPFFWLILLAWQAVLLYCFSQSRTTSAGAYFVLRSFLPLFGTLLVTHWVYLLIRGRRERMGELEEASGASTLWLRLPEVAAALLPALLCAVEFAILVLGFEGITGLRAPFAHLPYDIAEFITVTLFGLAAAVAGTSLFSDRRWAFGTALALWLLPLAIGQMLVWDLEWHWATFVVPSSAMLAYGFSNYIGLGPTGSWVAAHLLSAAGLAMLLLLGGLFAGLPRRERSSRAGRILGLLLLSVTLVTSVAVARFEQHVAAFERKWVESWEKYGGRAPDHGSTMGRPEWWDPSHYPLPGWRVDDYLLDVDLSASPRSGPEFPPIYVRAEMQCINESSRALEELQISLAHDFDIEEALQDSQPIKWSRLPGNCLCVSLASPIEPGATTALTLAYHGSISRWGKYPEGPLRAQASWDGRQGYLPAGLLWYPIPGRLPPPVHMVDALEADRILLPEAQWQVTCRLPAGDLEAVVPPLVEQQGGGASEARGGPILAFSGPAGRPCILVAPELGVDIAAEVTVVSPPHSPSRVGEIAAWNQALLDLLGMERESNTAVLFLPQHYMHPERGGLDAGQVMVMPEYFVEAFAGDGDARDSYLYSALEAMADHLLWRDFPLKGRRSTLRGDPQQWRQRRDFQMVLQVVTRGAVSAVLHRELGEEAARAYLASKRSGLVLSPEAEDLLRRLTDVSFGLGPAGRNGLFSRARELWLRDDLTLEALERLLAEQREGAGT